MTWFERLTGLREDSPEHVRRQLVVNGRRLHSRVNGRSWQWGELETPTLAKLRQRVRRLNPQGIPNAVREVVANVQRLHQFRTDANALFQAAAFG